MGLLEADAAAQAENRALRIFSAVGRMKAGVSEPQVRDELAIISGDLAQHLSDNQRGGGPGVGSLPERLVGEVRRPLLVLLVTVALLLLIACANVANLTLARTAGREREMAIRAALGAGRGGSSQLATESLVLAAIGGGCGLLLAMWAVDLLPAVLTRLPQVREIRVDRHGPAGRARVDPVDEPDVRAGPGPAAAGGSPRSRSAASPVVYAAGGCARASSSPKSRSR